MAQLAVVSSSVSRRPKPRKGKKPVRVNTHLPGDLVARVDRHRAKLAAGDPLGRAVSRTDAIRILLTAALDASGTE